MMSMVSRLNYSIFGNGYPVVFLHGFLESNSMWDYLSLENLNVQCVLIELPGHGKSILQDPNDVPSIGICFIPLMVLGASSPSMSRIVGARSMA